MSNESALQGCHDLIEALEECKKNEGVLQRLAGSCYELEKAVRMCRHEARNADRRRHVLQAREERKKIEQAWQKIKDEES